MTTGSPQLVRQWLLLKTLCATSTGKTIAELAAELEVNAKTIRRDIAVFRGAVSHSILDFFARVLVWQSRQIGARFPLHARPATMSG